jgi:hypothetical protein
VVSITVYAGVVGVLKWIHGSVFDWRPDAVFTEFVAEGFAS